MTNLKKSVLKYLLEFLLISFGVFLGIFVNEHLAQRKINREVKKSLSYIVRELELNRDQLSYSIEYHEKIKEGLQEALKEITEEDLVLPYFSNSVFKFTLIEGWTGITLPNYENVAYEGAKISGTIQELDIETIQLISQTYKQIEASSAFGKTLFNKMMAMDSETKVVDAVGMMELLTADVLNGEIRLRKLIEKAIGKLKAENPGLSVQ